MNLDVDELLSGFPRDVAVFPLSNVVLFPGAVLPLHIFEDRYRTMVADALAGDRLISLALLKQCSPEEYADEPPYHDTVCIGSIVHYEPLPDGKSNIALLGVSAARAVPAESDSPYRVARLEPLPDLQDASVDQLDELGAALDENLPGATDLESLEDQLRPLWSEDRLPTAVVNTCALTLPVFALHKLQLLEERSLARRVDRLIELIERPWQWN